MAGYDAFISYGHVKDKPIAAALQSVIQRLGKPWYRLRALRVFYDETALSDTPRPWPATEQALGQSRFLILLASQEAAASPGVDKEISWWLDHKGVDTLLIALTDGALSRDNAVGDFVWNMPLPPVLTGRFATEPKWVDLRAYRDGADPRDSRFIEAGADFAAAIHDRPKVDLLAQEVRQQRHALMLAWSAAGVMALLIAVAGWQVWEADGARRAARTDRDRAVQAVRTAIQQYDEAASQRDEAASQRDRAESNFGVAKNAAEKVVLRIAQELRNQELRNPDLRKAQGVQVESVRRMLEAAQSMMDELVRAAPDDLPLQRSRAAMFLEFAETYAGAGDLARARAAADESLAIRRKLAAADAGNAGWQRDLSVLLNRVGEVRLTAGDRVGALAAYEESLAVRRKLAATDPGNAGRQRDVSVVLNRVGDARMAAGDRTGALAAYEDSLAVMRKLAATDAGHAGWQRDVSAILDKVGDVRLTAGDRAGALAAYEESLATARKLAAADPGNAAWQTDLVVSLHKLSTVSEPSQARTALREALDIVEALARDNRLAAAQQNWPQLFRDALGEPSSGSAGGPVTR